MHYSEEEVIADELIILEDGKAGDVERALL